MFSHLAIAKVMTCIALSLLNLLLTVSVELLSLVFDHQSLYVFLVCLKVVIGDLLIPTFEQVSKFIALHPFLVLRAFSSFNRWNTRNKLVEMCFLSTERLCSLFNNNYILDYGLLLTKVTFLTHTSILTENPFKGKEEDVKETRGRKVSFFVTMIVHVFSGKGSNEETLVLVRALQLLLLINVLCFAFFLPIKKEYLDNKVGRFYGLWLQKWVKTALNLVPTNLLQEIYSKNKKENSSFLFKDSTFSKKREEISWSVLFSALLLCFAVLYLIWQTK